MTAPSVTLHGINVVQFTPWHTDAGGRSRKIIFWNPDKHDPVMEITVFGDDDLQFVERQERWSLPPLPPNPLPDPGFCTHCTKDGATERFMGGLFHPECVEAVKDEMDRAFGGMPSRHVESHAPIDGVYSEVIIPTTSSS